MQKANTKMLSEPMFLIDSKWIKVGIDTRTIKYTTENIGDTSLHISLWGAGNSNGKGKTQN